MKDQVDPIGKLMGLRYKAHPWHGVDMGSLAPEILTAFIEMVPTDTVKFEVDKASGYLSIDRPQRFSNLVPALYGFIPQTYSGQNVAEFTISKTGLVDVTGDGDPLDICVLTENAISHGDILVQAIPIGGFRMLDGKETDDKIIAVLKDDGVYGKYSDIDDVPNMVLDRLKHYFLTYKDIPGEVRHVEITHTFNKEEAHQIIKCSVQDYDDHFANFANFLNGI